MPAADLRARLIELRRVALEQLAALDAIDGGLLRVAADAGTVLAAIEAEADAPPPQPGGRVVATDDGQTIRLTLYHDAGPPVAVELEPRRALRLAEGICQLIPKTLLDLALKTRGFLRPCPAWKISTENI